VLLILSFFLVTDFGGFTTLRFGVVTSRIKDIVIRFTYTYGNPPEFPTSKRRDFYAL